MSFNQMLHCVQHDSLALMSFSSPSMGGSVRRAREAFFLPLLEGVSAGRGRLFLLPHYGGSARRAREAFFSPSLWRECPQGEGGHFVLSYSSNKILRSADRKSSNGIPPVPMI